MNNYINLVAISLKKKYEENVFFYHQNIEVDFYIPTEKMAIQVSYSLQDEATYKREVNALLKISRVFETDKLYIITNDEEKTIEEQGRQIMVVPIYKWLLDKSI